MRRRRRAIASTGSGVRSRYSGEHGFLRQQERGPGCVCVLQPVGQRYRARRRPEECYQSESRQSLANRNSCSTGGSRAPHLGIYGVMDACPIACLEGRLGHMKIFCCADLFAN